MARMNILIRTIQDSYLVLSYLFRLKRYYKSKLLHFFFDFWSDFWYPRKGNCLLFVGVVIIIVGTTCFLFKAINHLLQCFSIISIFAKYIRYSISNLKYFSEQILVALARNPLNMLVIVSGGIQECGLICTFVRAHVHGGQYIIVKQKRKSLVDQ